MSLCHSSIPNRNEQGCSFYKLNFDFASQNIEIHNKIAGKAVEWIFESGGFVFLKKEMSNPSEKISDHGHKPHQLILCGVKSIYQNDKE